MLDESSTALPTSFASDSETDNVSELAFPVSNAGESENDKLSALTSSTSTSIGSENDTVSVFQDQHFLLLVLLQMLYLLDTTK